MKEFVFFRDQKVITWSRDTVLVKAETREEALEKLKAKSYGEIAADHHENVCLCNNTILYDFEEKAEQGDVIQGPTVEIRDYEDDETLYYSADR
jgi:hypothetical protein